MSSVVLQDRLQRLLDSTYKIERELGGGGMSRVFLAEERAFGRKVVVKVLEPAEGEELSAERFAREIRVAAALQQANIVPLLTAGGAGNLAYYTMPYVEGRSLRERLLSGPMPLGDAVSVLRDVARALAFAHRQRVVHRDIKPENVLLSGGTAVVTDFGIAKAIHQARATSAGAASTTLTRDGTSVGTPAYMSPEQCAGDPRIDHRSDIYSWGIMAYELLAGRHPYAHCRSTHELITAHLIHAPEPIVDRRPDCPPALVALVARCLQKDPTLRPQTADEIVQALDVSAVTATAGVLHAAPEQDEPPSVAVLPFSNHSPNPEDEFFADGMSEEVMSALARVRGLRVAARTSCFAFKGKQVDLRDMAEKLGVRTVLEGSVRRAGPRIRVSTTLVDAEDGMNLWSERYDREMSDIFAVQDEIAQAIAETLGTTLRTTLAGVMRTPRAPRPAGPANVEAYEEYLRGRLHLDQRSTDIAASIACFERAAALDPSLSVAHSGLAHVYSWLGLWYIAPSNVAFAKVRESADRAHALDPSDAVAFAAKAIMALWHDWSWSEAERLAQRAIDLAPGLPLGYSVMTYVRVAASQHEAAIAAAERAVVLDPLSNAAKTDLGDALRFAGRHEEALRVLEPVVQREPGHILANLWMAYLLDALGDPAAALSYVERGVAASARNTALVCSLARILARAGRMDEARAARDELHARGATEYVAPYIRAVASMGVDDADTTLAHLEQAVVARDCHMMLLHRDYFWAPLHDDPRFRAVVAAVGMPQPDR